MMRTRSPSFTSMVGPGMLPLNPQTSATLADPIGEAGRNSRFTTSAVSKKTFTPSSIVQGSLGTSGVSTGTIAGSEGGCLLVGGVYGCDGAFGGGGFCFCG